MLTPCPKHPGKIQLRTLRHAEKVAVAKSWETGKLTHPYYCAACLGGCAAYHLATSIPMLADDIYPESEEDDDG